MTTQQSGVRTAIEQMLALNFKDTASDRWLNEQSQVFDGRSPCELLSLRDSESDKRVLIALISRWGNKK